MLAPKTQCLRPKRNACAQNAMLAPRTQCLRPKRNAYAQNAQSYELSTIS